MTYLSLIVCTINVWSNISDLYLAIRTTPNLTITQQRGLPCVRIGSQSEAAGIANTVGIAIEL